VRAASATTLVGGYSNETVRVDTAGGSFVVRRYGRLHVSAAEIAFEHALAAHAASRMTEIVAPLRDPEGRTLLAAPDGGLAAVFPYVDGVTGRRDAATGAAAARVLARFHRAVRDVHVGGGMRSVRFVGALSGLRERFVRFAADASVGRALDWDALIAAATAATARAAPLAAGLPHVIVHGDPNPANVVTGSAGEVRALLDFDFAHETERVYDLGVLLDEFARAGDDAPLDLARIAELIAAYAAEAPLTADERALVPEAMLRRAAWLVWYVVTRHGERVPGDVGGAPRYAARVREIAAAAAAIREAAHG
jgi:Ser/Thr protein kinase RdoA (MazF antagonist)